MGLNATAVIVPSQTDIQCNDLDLVKEDVEFLDGCPVLPKLQMHVTARGQCATLEKVIRDRQGRPVDLTNCLCSPTSSASASDDTPLCGIVVRFMEATGIRTGDPIFEEQGFVVDAANGVVRVTLPDDLVRTTSLYKATWGIFEEGRMTYAVEGWLLVEPSLFGFSDPTLRNQGPPTIKELRLTIRDNAPNENTLLDDVEFSDMEVGYAFLRPVREFFEFPPPLTISFTTKDFPFKEHWIKAIQGYLYSMAEAWYRRNRLGTSAGGITIDDRNKEREYLRASKILLEEWRLFLKLKKVEINAAAFTGSVNSTYGGIGGL